MINLYDAEIVDILPESISDPDEVKAVSYAIKKAMQKFLGYCDNAYVYASIDTMPEFALDLLAVELNTQYYDTGLPIENKRELIKNTFIWYQNSGTPSAVEELIAAVFGEGEVKEWFEYGDEPYYFKILTNAQLTPDIAEQFATIIGNVKNARSRLRKIDIERSVHQTEYAAIGGVVSNVNTHIYNHRQHEIPADGTQYFGIGMRKHGHIVIGNGS